MSLYAAGRAALFRFDAETAHQLTVTMLQRLPKLSGELLRRRVSLPTRALGLDFRNPIGIAAGLDKNGECVTALSRIGFGFVEVGTVTPRPQAGNPRPRMFRLAAEESVINRLGFNNKGVDYLCRQLERSPRDCVLGVNIGKNADTPNEQAAQDYLHCLRRVYPLADYVTVNISSPNTRNLRELQQAEPLRRLLDELLDLREQLAAQHGRRAPLLLKIAPDLDAAQRDSMAAVINASAIDGIIATNTTIARDAIADHPLASQAGGLSGRALRPLAQQQFSAWRSLLRADLPMVGVGGISDTNSARERWAAGAALLQVYTGFVFRGPALLDDCVAAAGGLTPASSRC